MKEIKLDASKVWHKWEQVPFGKFLAICEATHKKNDVKILSIATGIDEHVLRKAKIGPDFEVVMTRLRFLYLPPVWIETPKTLGGITMPENVIFESVEQFETMRQQYSNVIHDVKTDDPVAEYKRWGVLAAIYYQPEWERAHMDDPRRKKVNQEAKIDPGTSKWGQFDADRAMDMVKDLEKLSCVEVVSVGRFFWAKLVSLRSGIPLTSLTQVTLPKKKKPGFLPSLRRSISTLRSKFSRVAIFSSKRKS